VVIIGLDGSDLDGKGEEGDRFTGDLFGDCWTPPTEGGVGAGRDGCIGLSGGDFGTTGIDCSNIATSREYHPLSSRERYAVKEFAVFLPGWKVCL
jgi:hypothetical protein